MEPNWDEWAHMLAAPLWHAVLLSCNVTPVEDRRIGLDTGIVGPAKEPYEPPPDFDRRLKIAIAHRAPGGIVPSDRVSWWHVATKDVQLVQFANIAVRCGFTLPRRFPRPESIPSITVVNGYFSGPLSGPCSDLAMQVFARFASSDEALGPRCLGDATWNELNCRMWCNFIERHGLRRALAFYAVWFDPKNPDRPGDWPDFAEQAEAWARVHAEVLRPYEPLFCAYPGPEMAHAPGIVVSTPLPARVGEEDGEETDDFSSLDSAWPTYEAEYEDVSKATFTRDMHASGIIKKGAQGKPQPCSRRHLAALKKWRDDRARKS